MSRNLALLAALLLLLSGCAAREDAPAAEAYSVYYAVSRLDANDGGDAIRPSAFYAPDGAPTDTASLAELMTRELLAQPADALLRSPFPGGTELQKLSVAGGRATVDLSEEYARLSGIDLSIADACLTLTLTQLDGIYAVRITANGRELPYQETQLLTAADTLLSGGGDAIRPINVSLYFLDVQTGELRAQAQTLALYEGQTRASAVLDALKRGPEGDDSLRGLLPEGFAVLSSRTENGICYVNLDGRASLPEEEALRVLAVESLERSLLSLDGVDEVQFLVDGAAAPQRAAPAVAPAEPAET